MTQRILRRRARTTASGDGRPQPRMGSSTTHDRGSHRDASRLNGDTAGRAPRHPGLHARTEDPRCMKPELPEFIRAANFRAGGAPIPAGRGLDADLHPARQQTDVSRFGR
ncbi:hypothetical protein HBB16_00675 [Pseudonocardia sp. MCCB 268]|nr:hypothetical protein [Pseudonocardia cytotoxica]